VPSIASRTSGVDWTASKVSAPTTAASAMVEPTDRSMPRVTMTSSWAIASTAITAVCARTLPRLRVVKKTGDSSDAAATTAISISAGPVRMSASATLGHAGRRDGTAAFGVTSGSVVLNAMRPPRSGPRIATTGWCRRLGGVDSGVERAVARRANGKMFYTPLRCRRPAP
jgi:hypothetical protein